MLEVFGQLISFLLHLNKIGLVYNLISSGVQSCKEKLREIAEESLVNCLYLLCPQQKHSLLGVSLRKKSLLSPCMQ